MAYAVSRYSLDLLRDEVRHLIEQGYIHRQQPIYGLCRYISPREWIGLESELEANNFLLRDPIGDLIGQERWTED